MREDNVMGRLDGKVAIISGGARGQGAEEGRLFASEGAAVVLTDVLDADGEKMASEIGGMFLHHDVTSEEAWQGVVKEAVEQHGKVDILVNNAGIYQNGLVTEMALDDYRRIIEVNQVGVFLGMKHVAPAIIDAGGGAIVNISSIAGMRGGQGSIAYGASKWAVRGMTKVAARELGQHGIRVNSIHPGLIETAMLHQVPGVDSGDLDRMTQRIPLGRIAEAEEVAKLALFLASEESSYCSGAEFIVDGGMTA
jgi:3alpha(or 20beta)-hydroxysteroid dehydrogenase